MIAISELAKELDVSRQAIYNKINVSLKEKLAPHVHEKDGQKFIDDEGVAIIKSGTQSIQLSDLQEQINKIAEESWLIKSEIEPVKYKVQPVDKDGKPVKDKRYRLEFADMKKQMSDIFEKCTVLQEQATKFASKNDKQSAQIAALTKKINALKYWVSGSAIGLAVIHILTQL